MNLIITSQNHLHFKSDCRSVYLKFNIKVTFTFTLQTQFQIGLKISFSSWLRWDPLLYMLYLTCKCTSRSSSKRAAVGVRQHRINGNCPNNNQRLASNLMKHLDVQFYRTEIGICNLDNKSINDFDFQNRFRFKNKMKSKNEFHPVCHNIH